MGLKSGRGGWDRTTNHRINSAVLYQLSYTPACFSAGQTSFTSHSSSSQDTPCNKKPAFSGGGQVVFTCNNNRHRAQGRAGFGLLLAAWLVIVGEVYHASRLISTWRLESGRGVHDASMLRWFPGSRQKTTRRAKCRNESKSRMANR